MSWFLAVHIPLLFAFGIYREMGAGTSAVEVLAPAICLAMGRVVQNRRFAAFFITAGLVFCSSILVHMSGGMIEAHFHFFVLIGFIALYQDWVPFLWNAVFTVMSHGVGSALASTSMFDHHAAQNQPWSWALIHGVAVLAACVGVVIFWRHTEIVQQRNSSLMAELGASEIAAAQTEAQQRRTMSDLLVNLARRNQSLLNRQLALIAELEQREREPEALAELFQLDHLATRIRRNAESLLVLSGDDPPRLWGRPMPLSEVVRAAAAEVEDYSRVEVLVNDHIEVAGRAVADLAHLLAELIENATTFSPPGSPVRVRSHLSPTNWSTFILSIEDTGIGMSDSDLDAANVVLAEPHEIDMRRSTLGFHVVSRLARRYQLEVRVAPTPGGGLTALVTLPNELVTERPVDDHGIPVDSPAYEGLPEGTPGIAPSPAALGSGSHALVPATPVSHSSLTEGLGRPLAPVALGSAPSSDAVLAVGGGNESGIAEFPSELPEPPVVPGGSTELGRPFIPAARVTPGAPFSPEARILPGGPPPPGPADPFSLPPSGDPTPPASPGDPFPSPPSPGTPADPLAPEARALPGSPSEPPPGDPSSPPPPVPGGRSVPVAPLAPASLTPWTPATPGRPPEVRFPVALPPDNLEPVDLSEPPPSEVSALPGPPSPPPPPPAHQVPSTPPLVADSDDASLLSRGSITEPSGDAVRSPFAGLHGDVFGRPPAPGVEPGGALDETTPMSRAELLAEVEAEEADRADRVDRAEATMAGTGARDDLDSLVGRADDLAAKVDAGVAAPAADGDDVDTEVGDEDEAPAELTTDEIADDEPTEPETTTDTPTSTETDDETPAGNGAAAPAAANGGTATPAPTGDATQTDTDTDTDPATTPEPQPALTADGLVRRVPGAGLAAALRRDPFRPNPRGTDDPPSRPVEALDREAVRSMLSQFQASQRAGRAIADAPVDLRPPEEET